MEDARELQRAFEQCSDDVTTWLQRASDVTGATTSPQELSDARARGEDLGRVCGEGSNVTRSALEQMDVLAAKLESLGSSEADRLRERVGAMQKDFEERLELATEQ